MAVRMRSNLEPGGLEANVHLDIYYIGPARNFWETALALVASIGSETVLFDGELFTPSRMFTRRGKAS
jgi:hypothetical protein